MNVFTDHVISQNDTVSYNSTFLDGTATSDNGVFYSTFDAAAVGNDGSLDACGFIIMCGARVVCTGVDRPLFINQRGNCFVVDQFHVCFIVALEIRKSCKISAMGNSANIQSSTFVTNDIAQSIHGRNLLSFFNQFYKELFFHNICIHENVSVLGITAVSFKIEDTLLTVQLNCSTVQEFFLGVVYGMIKQSNVCTGINVCGNQAVKISRIDHIVGHDNNIWMVHFVDAFHVLDICGNISVVKFLIGIILCEENLKLSALGVDVVMTAGTNMFNK